MMKIKNIIFISLSSLLLFSCSTEDNGTEGSKASSLSVSAALPGADSRLAVTTDDTHGLVTTWTSGDKLSVFNKYLNSLTGQAYNASSPMLSREFSTTQAAQIGTFTYSGEETYAFNTSANLYAFNQLATTSNYTQSYSNGNFTLNLLLSGQDGTLSNLYKYDAMYGYVQAADNASIAMHHLTTALRFDLKNSDFGSTTVKNIKFTSESATTSILPGSTASTFTLSDATTPALTSSLTGGTSWTPADVTATSGKASIYLMTYPFQSINGYTLVRAENASGVEYGKYLPMSNLNLTSGNVKNFTVAMKKSNAWYCWSATDVYPSPAPAISATEANHFPATGLCANCPTYNETLRYLAAGVYWDANQAWTDVYGQPHKGGLWLMKKSNISGFADTAPATTIEKMNATTNSSYFHTGTPADTSKYFFLPAAGCKGDGYHNSDTYGPGIAGFYWLGTGINNGNHLAFYLVFASINGESMTGPFVKIVYNGRGCGYSLWTAQ